MKPQADQLLNIDWIRLFTSLLWKLVSKNLKKKDEEVLAKREDRGLPFFISLLIQDNMHGGKKQIQGLYNSIVAREEKERVGN